MPSQNISYLNILDQAQEIAPKYDLVKNSMDLFGIIVECQIILEKVNYEVIGLDNFMHSPDLNERPQIWTEDVYFQKGEGLVLLSRTMVSPVDFQPKMDIIYASNVPRLISTIRRNQENGMIKRREAYFIRKKMVEEATGTIVENLVRAILHGGQA